MAMTLNTPPQAAAPSSLPAAADAKQSQAQVGNWLWRLCIT